MSERNQADPIRELVELDKLIHEPRRFGIMNALDRAGDLGFVTLRRLTGLTQGNLVTHLRKLEEAGLIEISKRTFLSRPYSRIYITDAGRDALRSHWRRLDNIKKEVERWQLSDEGDDDLTSEEFAARSREQTPSQEKEGETGGHPH